MRHPTPVDLPNPDSSRRRTAFAGIALLVLLLLTASQWVPVLRTATQHTEWLIEDWIHQHGRKAVVDPYIVVLGVDEASLDLSSAFPEDIEASPTLQLIAKGWPWPRQVWADVIEKLTAAGARVIGIDFAFATATPDHPEWDAALHAALERHRDRVVIGADYEFSASKARLVPPSAAVLTSDSLQKEPRLGYFTYWPDDDGVVRRGARRHGEDVSQALSFPAAVLQQARLKSRLPGSPDEPQRIRFGPETVYTPSSLHEIFVPALWETNYANGEFFRGKVVLVGPSARHFQDDVRTPVGTLFGVQLHAHFLAAFRHGQTICEWSPWLVLGLSISATLLVLLLILLFPRPFVGVLVTCGLVVLLFLVQRHFFDRGDMVLAMLLPANAAALAGLTALTHDFIQERRQRERLRAAITGYFSPDMEEQILRQPASYFQTLRGARRHITLLFSDLRGFTSLSEQLPAEDLVLQLNEYLDRMVQTVFATGGSIDKFIGDAVMAVWGRLRDDASMADLDADARGAVTTALNMRRELMELNRQWAGRNLPPLAIGVGLHQGEAVVGDMGSQLKKEFTAIGDTVNLSARLEGVTKEYGVDIILSESLRQRLGDAFLCRSADLVRVKGKREPVAVYAVLGRTEEMPAPSGLVEYEAGIRSYRAGQFGQATQQFTQARAAGLDDTLTQLYLQRCADLQQAPPAQWDGVFTMTKK